MILPKAFVMERERYDGADIAHILQACAEELDWAHLIRLFGDHWRLLLSQLILFGFIYPGERDRIPAAVLRELTERLANDTSRPEHDKLCGGTLISREQFLHDIKYRGYRDARLAPTGGMTPEQIAHWTAAIGDRKPETPGCPE